MFNRTPTETVTDCSGSQIAEANGLPVKYHKLGKDLELGVLGHEIGAGRRPDLTLRHIFEKRREMSRNQ